MSEGRVPWALATLPVSAPTASSVTSHSKVSTAVRPPARSPAVTASTRVAGS